MPPYEDNIYFDNHRLVYPDAVVSVEEPTLQPEQFILYQNYPNPFNPSTIIKYTIPFVEQDLSRSNMSELKFALQAEIKAYDILGKEVVTLVNEYSNPGYYTVSLNANNLSSGIYYYR